MFLEFEFDIKTPTFLADIPLFIRDYDEAQKEWSVDGYVGNG